MRILDSLDLIKKRKEKANNNIPKPGVLLLQNLGQVEFFARNYGWKRNRLFYCITWLFFGYRGRCLSIL
jgi:hypothetical protein